ncbi:MAG: DUF4058 family protein [Gemmataceae bacterium]
MPIHDWTRVDAGIFHAFHHRWISAIADTLNAGLLPADFYALPEQVAARSRKERYLPDLLTLRGPADEQDAGGGTALTAPPRPATDAGDMALYRRRQNIVSVRHASGDRPVAVVEIVSPGNKDSDQAWRLFVDKSVEFLGDGLHLLVLDLIPPAARDPNGVHGAIWTAIEHDRYRRPADKPLTVVSYSAGDPVVEAFVEPLAVGDPLPEVPLFLEPGRCVVLPLEPTYQAAWATVPRRWRQVIEG